MLENCSSKEERWEGVQKLVQGWLAERQELVVIYCSLSGVQDFSVECDKSIRKLKLFCEILVDYVSAGHFEVYDQLLQEAEDFDDKDGEPLWNELYPKITDTTQACLDFNDIYDTDEHCLDAIGQLKDKLSLLGEILESRFAMEDKLIEVLHLSHAQETA